MKAKQFNPNEINLTITDAAKVYLTQLLIKEKAKALRLSITTSGCSGYMYELNFINEANNEDIKKNINVMTLYIDGNNFDLLNGTEIDYVNEGINKVLKFKNPKAQAYCGCGESFTV